MIHVILAVIVIGIVWFAWINFKEIGLLRTTHADLSDDERRVLQMKHINRVILCMILLAIMPWLFILSKEQ
jgi:hypothetical protein